MTVLRESKTQRRFIELYCQLLNRWREKENSKLVFRNIQVSVFELKYKMNREFYLEKINKPKKNTSRKVGSYGRKLII